MKRTLHFLTALLLVINTFANVPQTAILSWQPATPFAELNHGLTWLDETAKSLAMDGLSGHWPAATGREFTELIESLAESLEHGNAAALDALIEINGYARLVSFFKDAEVAPELWPWLLNSTERAKKISRLVTSEDNGAAAAKIFEKIYTHDPADRDAFFNLALALALVWDTPRKRMDPRIGKNWLPPDDDICAYYDYFKNLYRSGDALVSYDSLSPEMLVFVVNTTAPISELEWATAHITGPRNGWGRHYTHIPYDLPRRANECWVWPHREYSLKEIEENHGISADRAYYCVMSARAHGLPCIYFQGRGPFIRHAWFGYMQTDTQWDLDVGRQTKQGVAIGCTIHPQTNIRISDYEQNLYYARIANPEYTLAHQLNSLAQTLYHMGFNEATRLCAHEARTVDPLCRAAWETEVKIIYETKGIEAASAVLDLEIASYRPFPEMVTEVQIDRANYLRQAGLFEQATNLLRNERAAAHTIRADLQQKLALAQAEVWMANDQFDQGMLLLEKMIIAARKEGGQTSLLESGYLSLATQYAQRKRADIFFGND